MVNKMKLRGKIGVYGRSLGGLAACHLANKYPNIIQAIIGNTILCLFNLIIADRTFSDLETVSTKRISFGPTSFIYKAISCSWKTENHANFATAPCFKILACDPADDVIDNFASLAVGVSQQLLPANSDTQLTQSGANL